MHRFFYHLRPTRVVFGAGAVNDVSAELSRAKLARPFVVSTAGRWKASPTVQAALRDVLVGVFTGAELHVPSSVVADALDAVTRVQPDCLISYGGGSSTGLGKALAAATSLPLVSIPTTYSGSEMTDIWGVTDAHAKRTGRTSHAAPSIVIYDPELTVSLSAHVSGASGMNAAAHAVEALYAPDANPVVLLLAAESLRKLATHLPRIATSPHDLDVRSELLLAAHFAGVALNGSTMGLHHKLCHVLGGSFGLPHAETHAVLLPHVVRYNAVAAHDAVRAMADALGVSDAAVGLHQLNRTLDLSTSLRDLGFRSGDIDAAAELAMGARYPNPRPISREDVKTILQQATDVRRATC